MSARREPRERTLATALTVLTLGVVLGSGLYVAVASRATVKRNNAVLDRMEAAIESLEASVAVEARTTRAERAAHDFQSTQVINQLRRGQRCLAYIGLAPTAAWTDAAIVLCLREGVLPKGTRPR